MSELLDAASGIGRRITGAAIWHGARCAWVGAVARPSPGGGPPRAAAAALGPDLYSGSAGVALFLAHLHVATGDHGPARTALGAVRYALDAAGELPSPTGLYTGRLGVALAAARCGLLLGADDVVDGAALLGRRVCEAPALRAPDLLEGSAGTVAGMLALGSELGDERMRLRALDLGESLGEAAGGMPLTGMAHGEAGVVHALHELSAAGAAYAAPAAARAVTSEDVRFDEPTGNWADLRPWAARRTGDIAPASAMAWCHGAPGIVLSRRRAGEADGPALTTRLGARTVERWLRAAIATRPGNFCLCHGIAGNAEALWESTGTAEARSLARQVAALGIEEHSMTGRPWPCGAPVGETPGLMLGLAGIGLFLLRVDTPAIPSVLAIGPPPSVTVPGEPPPGRVAGRARPA